MLSRNTALMLLHEFKKLAVRIVTFLKELLEIHVFRLQSVDVKISITNMAKEVNRKFTVPTFKHFVHIGNK